MPEYQSEPIWREGFCWPVRWSRSREGSAGGLLGDCRVGNHAALLGKGVWRQWGCEGNRCAEKNTAPDSCYLSGAVFEVVAGAGFEPTTFGL